MKKERKKVAGPFPSFDPKETEKLWMEYRDPETGEPINYTWRGAWLGPGKDVYDEYFFEDYPNGIDGLPTPAVDDVVRKLWAQWWAWKRGEIK